MTENELSGILSIRILGNEDVIMNCERVQLWEEKVVIPTYETGKPEKNPIFSEKRVYQGSSGRVYPYPAIEFICNEKSNKEYKAVFLENDYLHIMILPELGGRIQRAYDKTNGYDFVYYNHVIKPALVGLTGPWISGGIEFNWPQHHRPTTFMSVDYVLEENEDGSKTLVTNDVDQMYGTKAITKFTLYPDKAYLEVTGQLYNRTSLPQTFLWWANPAVAVNEYTQSIFPPDVTAVMDHGKRDVSEFPIARGTYYKHDYSNDGKGTDISRYKNIPVPTSYMAEHSEFDFVGGYDHKVRGGLLHVADHHVSPGKKQWTWGCGEFGKAWDRNLTDEDGPYIELMTGMFTDNQPDFSYLKPFEEKSFTQYFMPYKMIGTVKNATKDLVITMEPRNQQLYLGVYATSTYKNLSLIVREEERVLLSKNIDVSPIEVYEELVSVEGVCSDNLTMEVWRSEELLIRYQTIKTQNKPIPKVAEPAKNPCELESNEELYLTGLHLEQYRHATYRPEAYYEEGLRRDPGDLRINTAYGRLLLRKGLFTQAELHFRKAIKRATWKNPNPYTSEPYYNLGLTLLYQEKEQEAYDAFYKATWSFEQQEMSFYYLAVISCRKGAWQQALSFVEQSIGRNQYHVKARALKVYLLQQLGRMEEAKIVARDSLNRDPFDYISRFMLDGVQPLADENHVLMVVRDYMEMGAYSMAVDVIQRSGVNSPLIHYYEAYCFDKLGEGRQALCCYARAEECNPEYCFPNKLEDLLVLEKAIDRHPTGGMAYYYLGNLLYDKQRVMEAIEMWEKSIERCKEYSISYRNLAIGYYNQCDRVDEAVLMMEQAYSLDSTNVRMLFELDQLYKKIGKSIEKRLFVLEEQRGLLEQRDDLYIEYITMLNESGREQEAYEALKQHLFHPWEGGEGKVTAQYEKALLLMASHCENKNEWDQALTYCRQALSYPINLGEGRLEGNKQNHIYYELGRIYKQLGDMEKANECFDKATLGEGELASVMYYNDQPADVILYQGLAYLELNKNEQAREKFELLKAHGKKHENDQVKIDYFAVSLPDMLIFEDDLTKKNEAYCYYLQALGCYGLREEKEATMWIHKAINMEPSNCEYHYYERVIGGQI